MLKSEIIELLKDKQENDDIDEILKGTDFAKSIQSIDIFKTLVATEQDFKSFMDSEKDKHHSKALDTWKQNNLQKLIDAEVKKATGQGETEEQKAIRELQDKLTNMEKEKTKAENIAKFKDVLAEKKIPSNMVGFLIADDEEATNTNISTFEAAMKTYIDNGVKARFKENEYIPPTDSGGVTMTKDKFMSLNFLEQQKFATENPTEYEQIMK